MLNARISTVFIDITKVAAFGPHHKRGGAAISFVVSTVVASNRISVVALNWTNCRSDGPSTGWMSGPTDRAHRKANRNDEQPLSTFLSGISFHLRIILPDWKLLHFLLVSTRENPEKCHSCKKARPTSKISSISRDRLKED